MRSSPSALFFSHRCSFSQERNFFLKEAVVPFCEGQPIPLRRRIPPRAPPPSCRCFFFSLFFGLHQCSPALLEGGGTPFQLSPRRFHETSVQGFSSANFPLVLSVPQPFLIDLGAAEACKWARSYEENSLFLPLPGDFFFPPLCAIASWCFQSCGIFKEDAFCFSPNIVFKGFRP